MNIIIDRDCRVECRVGDTWVAWASGEVVADGNDDKKFDIEVPGYVTGCRDEIEGRV